MSLVGFVNQQKFEKEHRLQDCDSSPADFCFTRYLSETDQTNVELRLHGGEDSLIWDVGVNFLDLETTGEQTLLGPIAPLFFGPGIDEGITAFDTGTSAWAVFGQVEYRLSDTLSLLGGLRYTDDEKEMTQSFIAGLIPFPLAKQEDDNVSFMTKLQWTPSDNLMMYGGVSQGHKSGTFNSGFGPPAPEDYSVSPEKLTSIEFGFKSTSGGGRTHVNGAVFHYDYKDHQAFVYQDLTQLLFNADTDVLGDERELMQIEIDDVDVLLPVLEDELREMMLPKDPYDGKNVVMEIRGAEGGEEANLFARDLYEMYSTYAANKGWKSELLSSTLSDMGGFNEITFVVKGDTAWRNLKFEGGPHRVQRVPVTESQGRIHTSSATVTVLPEADEVDVTIDERDLDIDVFRASGPGGQSVNTTDSAVRLTHRPSGVVVSMQDERSQLQNKARAMTVLRARLFELAQHERNADQSAERRSQTGGGGRSEKIRTYNYKENRVTDHRIGFTIHRLADVLAGNLQPVVDALAADERARLLAEGQADS